MRFSSYLLLMLLPLTTWAQDIVPATITGEMPQVGLTTEPKLTNLMIASLSLGSGYDDNAATPSTSRIGDLQYSVLPSFGFQQTRHYVSWSLSYAPGLTISQRFSNRDQLTQGAGAKLDCRVTPRLILHLRQDYAVSNYPFPTLGQNSFLPPLGPLNRPNGSTVLPQTRQDSVISNAGIEYHLSAHTIIGAAGSFSAVRYGETAGAPSGATFIGSRSTTGGAFFLHQFSRRQTTGVDYQLLHASFPHNPSHTVVNTFLLIDRINLSARSSLDVSIGPEYSRTRDQIALNPLFFIQHFQVFETAWSVAGEATYTWNGAHTAFQANYVRHITDGGGLFGAVRMNGGSVQLQRQLARRWKGELGAGIADNHLVNLSQPDLRQTTMTAQVGVSREISKNVWLHAWYGPVRQTGGLYSLAGNHNRAAVSLDYQFRKPIGR
jgi:hypothetical protein